MTIWEFGYWPCADGEVFYLISERIRFLDFSINRVERYQV
jgi:hypothetical protein